MLTLCVVRPQDHRRCMLKFKINARNASIEEEFLSQLQADRPLVPAETLPTETLPPRLPFVPPSPMPGNHAECLTTNEHGNETAKCMHGGGIVYRQPISIHGSSPDSTAAEKVPLCFLTKWPDTGEGRLAGLNGYYPRFSSVRKKLDVVGVE